MLSALLGLLATITGGLYWLISQDDYEVVFHQLDDGQASAVTNYLSKHGVSYKIDPTSKQITVNEKEKYKIRMELMSNGIINDTRVGFEIFDESDYGTTSFAQKVNFQRALQGELEKTISAIDGIRNTRVHLKFETTKTLFGKDKPVSASVVIYQIPSAKFSLQTVVGIKKLVAGAVEDLTQENVYIVNSSGVQLGETDGESHATGGNSLTYSQEQKLTSQAEKILASIFPEGGFEVSVAIEIDLTSMQSKIESIPNMDKGALVKKRKVIQQVVNKNSMQSSSAPLTEELDYIFGKQTDTITRTAGKILGISLGVVVHSNLETAELDEIKALLIASLGLNVERGDRIAIFSASPIVKEVAGKSAVLVKQATSQKIPTSDAVPYYQISNEILMAIVILLFLIAVSSFTVYRNRISPKLLLSDDEQKQLVLDLKEWVKNGQ